jgi:hypothetical protein
LESGKLLKNVPGIVEDCLVDAVGRRFPDGLASVASDVERSFSRHENLLSGYGVLGGAYSEDYLRDNALAGDDGDFYDRAMKSTVAFLMGAGSLDLGQDAYPPL